MDAEKLELLASVTNGGCWIYEKGRNTILKLTQEKEMHLLKTKKQKKTKTKKPFKPKSTQRSFANLCDILCWHNRVTHIPSSWSWCQDGAWREVGEVGLDLGEWSGRHDQTLLSLSGGYYLWS